MVSRADRSFLAEWWRSLDRTLLGAVIMLMLCGVLLSFAASSPVAERLGLSELHFTIRHAIYLVPSTLLLFGISLLSPRQVRRVALALLGLALLLMIAVLFIGVEVKGARRWLPLGSFSLQPSEFMKPAFVVTTAWLLAERVRRPDIPGNLFAFILCLITVALLVAQPDVGQTILTMLVWSAMFYMAGISHVYVIGLFALGGVGLATAYAVVPHVTKRIDSFVSGEGETYQVDMAREAIIQGGWLGQGPGEGLVKKSLPDSHADFPFAVAAEEFGIIACMALVALFAFIVLRCLSFSFRERDPYLRLSVAGLSLLFAAQSMINILVSLHLAPAKGMTLPFISYGGSSLMATAIGMGFLLALMRRRPEQLSSAPMPLPARPVAAT